MELQWLAGALVDDGLLDRMANLAGELVGSEHAFLQGDVFFYRKLLGNSSLFVGINVICHGLSSEFLLILNEHSSEFLLILNEHSSEFLLYEITFSRNSRARSQSVT